MNLLLVDQDPGRARRLMQRASHLGHLVSVTYDLDTALEWTAGTRFDLIVLNSEFPATIIGEALVKIRETTPSSHSRIAALSDRQCQLAFDTPLERPLDIEDIESFLTE
ncbi:hypothetical protein [Paraburkholderia xenovorans]